MGIQQGQQQTVNHEKDTHEKQYRKTNKYRCNVCEFIGNSNDVLKAHIFRNHLGNTESQERFSHQTRKPCFFYNKGICRNSDTSCKFLHVLTPKCKYADKCVRINCKFGHESGRTGGNFLGSRPSKTQNAYQRNQNSTVWSNRHPQIWSNPPRIQSSQVWSHQNHQGLPFQGQQPQGGRY